MVNYNVPYAFVLTRKGACIGIYYANKYNDRLELNHCALQADAVIKPLWHK